MARQTFSERFLVEVLASGGDRRETLYGFRERSSRRIGFLTFPKHTRGDARSKWEDRAGDEVRLFSTPSCLRNYLETGPYVGDGPWRTEKWWLDAIGEWIKGMELPVR